MAENLNYLGLDKFQLTIIKGNYASIKPSITKRDKALKKIDETTQKYKEKLEEAIKSLKQEADAYNEQIAMIDKFTVETTLKSCGIGLTTEQVMDFLEHPEKFMEYKASVLGEELFNQQEETHGLDAEEDKEGEDRIASDELKEAV